MSAISTGSGARAKSQPTARQARSPASNACAARFVDLVIGTHVDDSAATVRQPDEVVGGVATLAHAIVPVQPERLRGYAGHLGIRIEQDQPVSLQP
ncbi:hypothetical protein SMD20_19670 [Nonomuraea sp. LP-02]|nr:hypothetical protein [Nonomuraea sp. LP-02]MED7926484.1 hypothetical protein [Nonomuraea sp. LP-02]